MAVDDTFTVKRNSTTWLPVKANDYYPDAGATPLTQPEEGGPGAYVVDHLGHALVAKGAAVVTSDHKIRYTPPPDFVGTDTFHYFFTDWSWAKVTVKVVP